MIKQASNVRKHLRRFLTADPGRFAGGSAVSDPLGLLATERERLERRSGNRRNPAIPGITIVAGPSHEQVRRSPARLPWLIRAPRSIRCTMVPDPPPSPD
jgi:hypothetical protein